jgi:midasin (ATPase involved in ribosome maturation)
MIKQYSQNGVTFSDEGEVNLRDLNRLLKLYAKFMAETSSDHDSSILHCLDICYFQKINLTEEARSSLMQTLKDSSLVKDHSRLAAHFDQVTRVQITPSSTLTFQSPKPTHIGRGFLNLSSSNVHLQSVLDLQGPHTKSLQHLCDCLHTNFPLLVMSDDCDRFVENLQTVSSIFAQKLNRIIVNERSDTTQLLGCFEQTSNDLQGYVTQLVSEHQELLTEQVLSLEHHLENSSDRIHHQLSLLHDFISTHGQVMKRGEAYWKA